MYEIGSTFIQNYNTYPKTNWWMEFLRYGVPPIVTIITALLVYMYTSNYYKRTLLSSLDSKSGWRKTLFEIAGKNNIKLKDVYQFRAALRFNNKDEFKYCKNTLFDNMNIIIIKYCDKLITSYSYSESISLSNYEKETIRIFCRYMLADHWEKNKNKKSNFRNKIKEEELCIYTLEMFLKVNNIKINFNNIKKRNDKKYHCYKDTMYPLYLQANYFIDNEMTP